jgi:heme exporter protein A
MKQGFEVGTSSAVQLVGLGEEGEQARPAAARPAPDTEQPWLEARDLACERGDRLLFSGLNMGLAPGAMIQVEGRNGSGKTSLLRILCGLAQPIAGEVLWRGADVRRARQSFLANVCYLGHLHGVKGQLTPVENLRIARGLGTPCPDTSIKDALYRVGLRDYDDQICHSLSAGQRRRVAIARLLATRAKLWVLDEPFTSLDRMGVKMVEEMLDEHLSRGGMTVLTTHHPVRTSGTQVTLVTLGQ